ncbi:MAG: DNA-processing protein DprA [Clostridia bacterium]|nr:DNA-processing protein DprA [Clostridia bacterium]
MSSNISLKLYNLIKTGVIKSNAQFWKLFYNEDYINTFSCDLQAIKQELMEKEINVISVFDKNFPSVNVKLKNSEKPFFFAYKGDITLLNNADKNVAVIGVLTPTNEIVEREQKVVKSLIEKEFNIVSGLAKGCDTVAHIESVKNNAKTIAFLPSTIEKIYPKENIGLAKEIIHNGGLIISEYINEPKNKYESVKRFIERDRLQALYSKAVILIASYRKSEGDSGSRYAFEKAKEYGKKRLVMYRESDSSNLTFGLNKDYVMQGEKIVSPKEIEEL